MGTMTDRDGKVVSHFEDTLEDWRQAAEVEAGIRREIQERNAKLESALAANLNYRDLLLRYIDFVGTCEGTTFIQDRNRHVSSFTDEQWEELKRLNEEGRNGFATGK